MKPDPANKFYDPGEQRAARVNDLFGRIAPRYDLINDLLSLGCHRHWKRRVVHLANIHPGQRALDICCGTGDLAWALAHTGAQVVGLDFNGPMLALAWARTAPPTAPSETAAPRPLFVRADAQSLPFADEQFNAVTVGYGLRNLAHWQTGLREMWRVAKPGGRLVVLDFGKPSVPAWRWLYFAFLRWLAPVVGRLFCGDADTYGYILTSLNHYPAQAGVAAALREMNCANVQIINIWGGAMSINYAEKAA